MRKFAVESFRSFVGTRGAFLGVFFALLPAGAMSLGLALQSNLSVELGMSDGDVANLNLWSIIISALAMVLGGWLSDKWGRRRTLAVYLLGMSIPVIYLMWVLLQHHYIMPRPPNSPPMPELITQLWIASLLYAVFQGLMYGTRTAIMMDVTNPAVAATQFTAYMAMMNLAIAIAATWQGIAIEAWGYPTTLLIDAITGPLCVLMLPWMKRRAQGYTDALAEGRARKSALVLGVLCLVWLPYWAMRKDFGEAQPIMATFYTLVFISSGLFLLAGREVLKQAAGIWHGATLWVALLLFAMHGRHWLDKLQGSPMYTLADALIYLVPLAGGIVLLGLGSRNWHAVAIEEPQPA